MTSQEKTTKELIWFLSERAKELNCLYRIEELLSKPDADFGEICAGTVDAIPPGWQYPDVCVARVEIEEYSHASPGFQETPWVQYADVTLQEKAVGRISVYYTREMPKADHGPFLKEETKLLNTIADRLGHYIMYHRMKHVFQTARSGVAEHRIEEWRVALNLLRQTDRNLFLNISRRMLNFLCWSGTEEAETLLQRSTSGSGPRDESLVLEDNRPYQKSPQPFTERLSDEVFRIAAKHLSEEQILSNIQSWIQEDRLSFLVQVINKNLPLVRIIEALRRYRLIASEGVELPPPSRRGVQVSLIRRFLSSQPQYLRTAKEFIEIEDFYEILNHLVFSPESQGRLGGKGSGLFLAQRVVESASGEHSHLADIKVPRTWYIATDELLNFLTYNNLNEVVEQKYKDIHQVRLEYPHIVQSFKNSPLPTELVQGLSMVLDEFKDLPLIVRSSSLLEDRMGSSFSGKYKSLFLANQGSKQERLDALIDAIAEVYASTFGPDPISYRHERGLVDFAEEMGIMVQEVVGSRIGDYFMPAYAGVAFSRNEFRWSPRIRQQDGLLRLVPGLGTRAVDRVSDDFPVLLAPGQIGFRVNVTPDEVARYAPKRIDVINLRTNRFETIEVRDLLRRYGEKYPAVDKIVSVFDGYHMRKPLPTGIDFENEDLVVTFEGLVTGTPFVAKIKALLELLEKQLGTPVDIEFASDGSAFYLLQCRPQSYLEDSAPAPIPHDIPKEKIVFTASRYVSNGRIPDISHIVYVDPQSYDQLADRADLLSVARAIGKLNKLLPSRRFILMGPGRWGSRGDIKLGVKVSYADITNTAILIEVARQKGNYIPDLSFGTHFFQDLVEARIRYLPLYPDDTGVVFNDAFFQRATNVLPELLPEFAHLAQVVKVIDVPKSSEGHLLRVLMNADLDEAVGYLVREPSRLESPATLRENADRQPENFWAWRLKMAEHIASQLDPERFGVKGLYLIGSTKNATAGPQSDIDLLVHFGGTEQQLRELTIWFDGWSLCLDEMNHIRTGYRTGGLLDIHIVRDEDIAQKTSYAVKIDAVTDAARPLPLKRHAGP
ncbi:MAG: PEP/pyruvate-binding domain-containing protein [Acidobacteriota bacterium]